jgi:hypothetical protein
VDPELTGFVFCPAAGENPLGGAHEKIHSFSPPRTHAMDAERSNLIGSTLADLSNRTAELRGYL